MSLFYLDTAVWIDYHEARGINGQLALKLILKILEEGHTVLVSDLHIMELKNVGYGIQEISSLLQIVKPDNIRHVHIHREQIEEARKIARQKHVPKKDALHAILARDNEAILVSTDRHFQLMRHIVNTKRPDEL